MWAHLRRGVTVTIAELPASELQLTLALGTVSVYFGNPMSIISIALIFRGVQLLCLSVHSEIRFYK